ncbi:MAG: hypothetical protein ACFCD0_22080 [Gemmataceae bacterium]
MRWFLLCTLAGLLVLAGGQGRARPKLDKLGPVIQQKFEPRTELLIPMSFLAGERACVVVRATNVKGVGVKLYRVVNGERKLIDVDEAFAQGDHAYATLVWYPPRTGGTLISYQIGVLHTEDEPRTIYVAIK